jgi:hypothetical protein
MGPIGPGRWIAAVGATLATFAAPSPLAAAPVSVHMDENAVVSLAAPAGNILVGNPAIADVSLITPQKLAILGRTYGLTNVIVTDRMGRTIFQQEVNVAPAAVGRVSVYRGPLVSNFACSPRCERTPMPGEEKTSAYEPFSGGYKDYADRAKGESQGQGGN